MISSYMNVYIIYRERQRERERDRERETETERDRETEREREGGRERESNTHTNISFLCPTDSIPICSRSLPVSKNNLFPVILFLINRSAYLVTSSCDKLHTQLA